MSASVRKGKYKTPERGTRDHRPLQTTYNHPACYGVACLIHADNHRQRAREAFALGQRDVWLEAIARTRIFIAAARAHLEGRIKYARPRSKR